MASLSTCHLGLWLGWQILLNLVKTSNLGRYAKDESYYTNINFYLNSNVQHASSVSDGICDRTTLSV